MSGKTYLFPANDGKFESVKLESSKDGAGDPDDANRWR
jgi:hypothetical protein